MQDVLNYNFSFKKLFIPFTTAKAVILIIIIGLIVYANTFYNGFTFDDTPYILKNPAIHSVNMVNLISANSFNREGQYRPIPATYFALMYAMFKDIPFFYHFLQISLHILNAILVLYVFKRFFNNTVSTLLSLLFLLHPLQVESAAFIGSTGNPLLLFFGLSALFLSLESSTGATSARKLHRS